MNHLFKSKMSFSKNKGHWNFVWMKKYLRTLAITLLLFNGVNALYGGWFLITDPTGGKLQMPLSYLEHSFFNNYLIPGIILFITNGISSILIAALVIAKKKYAPLLIIVQGSILVGWIVIQIILLQTFYYLQLVLGFIGLLLMLCGYLLAMRNKSFHSVV